MSSNEGRGAGEQAGSSLTPRRTRGLDPNRPSELSRDALVANKFYVDDDARDYVIHNLEEYDYDHGGQDTQSLPGIIEQIGNKKLVLTKREAMLVAAIFQFTPAECEDYLKALSKSGRLKDGGTLPDYRDLCTQVFTLTAKFEKESPPYRIPEEWTISDEVQFLRHAYIGPGKRFETFDMLDAVLKETAERYGLNVKKLAAGGMEPVSDEELAALVALFDLHGTHRGRFVALAQRQPDAQIDKVERMARYKRMSEFIGNAIFQHRPNYWQPDASVSSIPFTVFPKPPQKTAPTHLPPPPPAPPATAEASPPRVFRPAKALKRPPKEEQDAPTGFILPGTQPMDDRLADLRREREEREKSKAAAAKTMIAAAVPPIVSSGADDPAERRAVPPNAPIPGGNTPSKPRAADHSPPLVDLSGLNPEKALLARSFTPGDQMALDPECTGIERRVQMATLFSRLRAREKVSTNQDLAIKIIECNPGTYGKYDITRTGNKLGEAIDSICAPAEFAERDPKTLTPDEKKQISDCSPAGMKAFVLSPPNATKVAHFMFPNDRYLCHTVFTLLKNQKYVPHKDWRGRVLRKDMADRESSR